MKLAKQKVRRFRRGLECVWTCELHEDFDDQHEVGLIDELASKMAMEIAASKYAKAIQEDIDRRVVEYYRNVLTNSSR